MIAISNLFLGYVLIMVMTMLAIMKKKDVKWVGFNPVDHIPRSDRPRTTAVPLVFEINDMGEIRILRRFRRVYERVNPTTYKGEAYLIAVVGWSGAATIRVRIKVSDLVKTYFGL